MERRPLGRTGIEVGVLGFGAMELRGAQPLTTAPPGPDISEDDVGVLLNAALDLGIDFIDTSPDYGASEERIGRHLEGRRSEFKIATKCGCVVGEWGAHRWTRQVVREAVEQSLRRMRTDYLDLVQFHMSPSMAELQAEDGLGELIEMRDQGLVRSIGMSGRKPHLMDQITSDYFDVFQVPYSVVQPEHGDEIAAAGAVGAGVVVRGGVARGVPADRVDDGVRMGSMPDPKTMMTRWEQSRLDDIASDAGVSRHELTLRFTLSNPHLSTTIVGTSKVDHLRTNAEIAQRGALPTDVYDAILERLVGGDESSRS